MNQLAALISDVLTGQSFVNIELNGAFYHVEQPNTIVVARMLKPLSQVEIEQGANVFNTIEKLAQQSDNIAQAIAWAVIGDADINTDASKEKFEKVRKQALRSTSSQLKEAFSLIVSLIDAQDFFECAHLAVGIVNQMSKQKEVTPLSDK